MPATPPSLLDHLTSSISTMFDMTYDAREIASQACVWILQRRHSQGFPLEMFVSVMQHIEPRLSVVDITMIAGSARAWIEDYGTRVATV